MDAQLSSDEILDMARTQPDGHELPVGEFAAACARSPR